METSSIIKTTRTTISSSPTYRIDLAIELATSVPHKDHFICTKHPFVKSITKWKSMNNTYLLRHLDLHDTLYLYHETIHRTLAKAMLLDIPEYNIQIVKKSELYRPPDPPNFR